MAGYSGTPLGKKLGLKPESSVFITGMPPSVKKDLKRDLATVHLLKNGASNIDLIHAFVHSTSELKKEIAGWKKSLSKNGSLWISWPKKTSRISSDINGDIVREIGLKVGLVDVKVCAVDEDWSGLKFMFRKEDR
jgi:hypothetical protein